MPDPSTTPVMLSVLSVVVKELLQLWHLLPAFRPSRIFFGFNLYLGEQGEQGEGAQRVKLAKQP